MKCNPWVGGGITGMGGIPMLGTGARGLTTLIKGIFRNNEQGFAYDPNDLTTLYQDVAGTIPVAAAGQPVGLVLDKSKGLKLGAELFIESDVSIAGQSSKLDGTRYRVYCPDGIESSGIRLMGKFIAGKWYLVEFTIDSVAVAGEGIAAESTQNQLVHKTVGRKRVLVLATNANFYLKRIGVCDYTVSSISVKEIAGNHAYQTVSASRPILRQTPILGAEKVVNGDFSSGTSAWFPASGGTLTVNGSKALLTSTVTGITQTSQNIANLAGKTVKVSCRFSNRVGTAPALIALWSGTATTGSASSGTAREGYLEFTTTLPTPHTGTLVLQLSTGVAGNSVEFDDVSVQEITGYRTDQNYLAFDGVDDFLVTNHINFTVTDKISLFAGVRKLSDSGTGMVFELSPDLNTNNGGFYLTAPSATNGNNYSFSSKGTVSIYATVTGYRSPTTNVLMAKSAISTDSLTVRIDGAEKMLSVADQGVGNYGYHQLFIGRRGGTSAPFSGNIYSLIGIGRLTSNSETIALEKSIAKNTGVVLSV